MSDYTFKITCKPTGRLVQHVPARDTIVVGEDGKVRIWRAGQAIFLPEYRPPQIEGEIDGKDREEDEDDHSKDVSCAPAQTRQACKSEGEEGA